MSRFARESVIPIAATRQTYNARFTLDTAYDAATSAETCLMIGVYGKKKQ